MSKPINAFPGYTFEYWESDKKYHNVYRGEDVGFGGYVYAEPGMYGRTVCFDVSGMHPASIRALNAFGEYTKNYGYLVDARQAIKHKDYDTAKSMFDGRLAPYLTDDKIAKDLSNALKIAQNSCFGMSFAKYSNPMRDPRNKNNIVALRGALTMVDLKYEVQAKGFKVIHCKTDSIKVVEPDEAISEFIFEYGKKYGYKFEIEHVFEKICLVNNAVYIAKLAEDDPEEPGKWTATGKQFAIPYVFKSLFSKEPIVFDDLCETKEVKTALYLDRNESLPDVTGYEKEFKKFEDKYKKGELSDTVFEKECQRLNDLIDTGHDYHFIGKVSSFCPIKEGCGGGVLLAKRNDKYDAAPDTKGYHWLEADMVKELGKEDDIDISYYRKLVDDAVETISQYGDFERFVSDDPYIPEQKEPLPNFMNIPEDADELVPYTA